ncbi:Ribosomal-protein-alanine N-acetyltransferase [Alteracholeplasma palmae J233]|uniref:[Ribosomal protein bS18]-alanine N-acetyltransferase n=1 Tax=Alteracholeplasma palmae (strain ATCC 49389 / J233) TaxID=1318466 RepID=U4KJS6_ALTPJ|nr:ribosomal protein S18-alanine N-acetyltransferase [Alteracholeplasma palmae]CCV63697.1 Ribosomal-protein-alanine N-acetyltransferase [Alteracholeplasma palmae J233]
MIQPLTINDLDKIVILENNQLKSSLGYDFLKQELEENPYAYHLVIKDKDEVIGYLSSRIFEDTSELLNIVVDKKYQNQKYGSKLLEHLINELKKRKIKTLILEVRPSNIGAQRLYHKYNFKHILSRKNYYKDEDAYVFLWENESL